MFRILLKDKIDESVIKEIKAEHKGDVDGISELYEDLIKDGACDSEVASRIYYVAYTLSLRAIEMIIVKLN
nr:hypothetical protein [Tissierella sp.]